MRILVKFCILFAGCLSLFGWAKESLLKEKLPNGTEIAFYKSQTASQKQLKQIETQINSRLRTLLVKSKKQSPKNNLQALRRFKQYLEQTQKDKKYLIAKTSLNAELLLLSEWLSALPAEDSLKNCREQIRRMRLKAHSLLQNPNKNKWLGRGLKLAQNICSKKNQGLKQEQGTLKPRIQILRLCRNERKHETK